MACIRIGLKRDINEVFPALEQFNQPVDQFLLIDVDEVFLFGQELSWQLYYDICFVHTAICLVKN
jgi:hypothetical protein